MRLYTGHSRLDDGAHAITTCDDRYTNPVAERILPDGAVHLIFNIGDRPSGERGAALPCLAMGATCEPTVIVLGGHLEQVCVRIRVGAAAALLGVPAREITDHGVSLDALWGAEANEMLERLAAARSTPTRVAIVTGALRDRARRSDAATRAVFEAVRRIEASEGTIKVRDLASDLGFGERRLQQLFFAHVGLSPKEVCRLARFRALLARCRRAPRRSWIELALDGGYYDQAHLTNEVRAFTGLTPGQLADGDFAFFQDATGLAG